MATFYIFSIGELVYYKGPPILNPQDWGRIVKYNNGIVNRDDLAIILRNDHFLQIADLYFQDSEIEVPRVSYKYLLKIE